MASGLAFAFLLAAIAAGARQGGWGAASLQSEMDSGSASKRVLIYTKTTAYVHESTPYAAKFIAKTCKQMGHHSVISDNSTLLEDRAMAEGFDAIVFVSNLGQIFDTHKEHIAAHIAAGKGIFGLHAIIGSFRDDLMSEDGKTSVWTSHLIEDVFGAHFGDYPPHPPRQSAKLTVDAKEAEKLGLNLPTSFVHEDEFFNYNRNPAQMEGVSVVASVDENSYEGGIMGVQHPVVWYRTLGKNEARVFYCGLGHATENYNGEGSGYVASFVEAGLKYILKAPQTITM
uniref:ThuA-like domain-containing protein n=1 Tax=Lotharella oceanica TaxID=641309 RepID=A0A7S2TM91_9EUKA|eukprot:CAMPEP_0170178726 /NCGR_PEP_ID=MMETSP0040_2-20121228/13549_1 /TAXON_ID=641309 /ORGANISM="Lotharella oceanica, Strain CCMP622" /LENGTH=284 /DNA_ID=CAMNT_0010422139 /DNA_START=40 /DNA_END=894 /DNA_ORIENTATION=+